MAEIKTDLKRIKSISNGGRGLTSEDLDTQRRIAEGRNRPIPGREDIHQGPPNFDPDQIVQGELTLETPEVAAQQKAQRRAEVDEKARGMEKSTSGKPKIIEGPQRTQHKPQFSPDQVSPTRMQERWDRATDAKGRGPVGGLPRGDE